MVDALASASAHWLERDTLVVRGADARSWLDGLVTCAVSQVQVGAGAYGLLLTKQGKIVSDVWLLFSADAALYVGVAPGLGEPVQALLDRYLVMEDAELSQSPALSWRLAARGGVLPPAGELATGDVALGSVSFVAQVGSADSSALPRASDLLAEFGFGAYGVDFSERDNPHEASLDRVAVSWTKGCYLGQEVVCMQDMRGKVKRRLTALAADDALVDLHANAIAAGPVPVLDAVGAPVGHVTSAHRAASGALLLASVATSALEGQPELSVLGRKVRLAASSADDAR